MAERRLFKEYKQLCKTPANIGNPQIVDLRPLNPEESIFKWQAIIHKPNKKYSQYYYHGKWTLEIEADAQYPRKPPKIQFSRQTRINHPNINFETGEICLDILKDDDWSPAWTLEHLVGAILILIDNPEPDSPLNVDSANLFKSDKLAFESVIQYTMWKENTMIAEKQESGEKILCETTDEDSEENEECEENEEREENEECEENEEREDSKRGVESDGFEDSERGEDSEEEKLAEISKPSHSPEARKPPALNLNKNTLLEHQTSHNEGELDYIHDLGRHITEEFLKKATEVQISTPQNLQHKSSSHQLAAVRQYVSNNVAKQIEEICSKTVSRSSSPIDKPVEEQLPVSPAQESFLEKIEQQVDEIRRLHEQQSLANTHEKVSPIGS